MDTPDSTTTAGPTEEEFNPTRDLIQSLFGRIIRVNHLRTEFQEKMRELIALQYHYCRCLDEAIQTAGYRKKRVPEVVGELITKGLGSNVLMGGLMPDLAAEFCAHDEKDNCDDCLNAIMNRWFAIQRFLESVTLEMMNGFEKLTGTYFHSGEFLKYDENGNVIYDDEKRR